MSVYETTPPPFDVLAHQKRLDKLHRIYAERCDRLVYWQEISLTSPEAREFVRLLEDLLAVTQQLIATIEDGAKTQKPPKKHRTRARMRLKPHSASPVVTRTQ